MVSLNDKGVIVYITPHLSTGGLPQYLWKKIEEFKEFAKIYCIEYSYYGPDYVVQRNKISDLLGDRFISLNGRDLYDCILEINPDVIHFEEIAETFVAEEFLKKIYSDNRGYYICETCHSSTIDPSIKRYLPDKIISVSSWINKKFSVIGVPGEILEYPILDLSPERNSSLDKLGLDPSRKHVLNVGLFTEGKNQGELIEYARSLEEFPIDFHFVGNQAMNFKHYWEPLMSDLPKNCKIWGERSDVDLFYQASDLFVFTSNFELNPLCVKEALSWKNKVLIKKLETYESSYDDNVLVSYLTENKKENVFLILESLGFLKNIK